MLVGRRTRWPRSRGGFGANTPSCAALQVLADAVQKLRDPTAAGVRRVGCFGDRDPHRPGEGGVQPAPDGVVATRAGARRARCLLPPDRPSRESRTTLSPGPWPRSARSAQELWGELREFATPDRTVVISSESFETLDPQQVRDQLEAIDVRVVAYMRPATSASRPSTARTPSTGSTSLDFDTFFDRMEPDVAHPLAPQRAGGSLGGRLRSRERQDPGAGSRSPDGRIAGERLPGARRSAGDLGLTDRPRAAATTSSPAWKTLESLRDIHGIAFVGRSPSRHPQRPRLAGRLPAWPFGKRKEQPSELGWTDRGRYLSLAQQSLLVDVHNREVELLDQVGVDARIPPIEVDRPDRSSCRPLRRSARPERRKFIELVAPDLLEALMSRRSAQSQSSSTALPLRAPWFRVTRSPWPPAGALISRSGQLFRCAARHT